jgi:Domain of unknown function (DUF4403)
MRTWAAVCAIPVMLLAACGPKQENPAPPRLTTVPEFPKTSSTLLVPVTLSLDSLQRALEAKTPKQLWSIDKHSDKCVAGQRVKAFGSRIKVTPDISCQIVGRVTRGAIALSGHGKRVTISMPVNATIAARDVAGFLKGKTATGAAVVRADVSFGLDANWHPHAKVEISYDWTNPPGIDFVGQRIRFVEKADKELGKVIAGLERDLQDEVAKAQVRPIIAGAWKQGFTVFELSRKNPPAWMRVTPVGLAFAGYNVEQRNLRLQIAAEAFTETFVGADVPKPEQPTPLPRQIPVPKSSGLRVYIPVVADYRELEPVVLRALRKLNKKGIQIEGAGSVNADFQKVTVYATGEGRLAVGVDAEVEPVGDRIGKSWGKAKGQVWLTGSPISETNSEVIRVRDIRIFGDTDRVATNLLLALANSDSVRQEIAGALTEDFSKDYHKVLGKAQKAIGDRQEGDFRLSVRINEVSHDSIQVTGGGLFMPVMVKGSGQIVYSPAAAKR